MESLEDAVSQGERLQNILLALAAKVGRPELMDAVTRHKAALAAIQATLDHFRADVLPRYERSKTILYGSRESRTFDIEWQRIRYRAIRAYIDALFSVKGSQMQEVFEDPSLGLRDDQLVAAAAAELSALAEDAHQLSETIGEDLYLYLYDLMTQADSAALVQGIVDSNLSPPQTVSASYSVFGLLAQAKAAWDGGAKETAYTFLLDANHMLGMQEGAKLVMRHLPALAPKVQGAVGAQGRHSNTAALKARAAVLFHELRPRGPNNESKPWKSGAKAAKQIWTALGEEHKNNPGNPEASNEGFRAIQDLCRQMHAETKRKPMIGIQLVVMERLPDGQERPVYYSIASSPP